MIMTSQHQEVPEFWHGNQVDERTELARNLLTDVYFTDSAYVREPAELAKRLFGVSRAVSAIVHANTIKNHESRIVTTTTKTLPPSRSELWLGALCGSMPNLLTKTEMFIADSDVGVGAMLSLHERHDQGAHSIWKLTRKVIIPSDELIINKLYSEPPVLHDTQGVYAHAIVHGEDVASYPFYSPEYQPGVTAAYLGVLQSLCRQLLNITTQKP